MCSVIKLWLLTGGALLFAANPALRVCADPNNLPFSDRQEQGFENRLATLMASDLGMSVEYTWFPQRGSFFRKTVGAGQCDVVMGVPAGMKAGVIATEPYYRSTYVFVTRQDRNLGLHSLNDARLRKLSIGVQVLGDSDRSSPPAQALIERGIVRNLVAFNIFGNLNEADPAADLIHAVENGQVDVAVAWGPMAGYFAKSAKVPLEVTAIDYDSSQAVPLVFDIAIGVRKADLKLRDQLNGELGRRKAEIDILLKNYGIPRTSDPGER